jgi:hypothetical protein
MKIDDSVRFHDPSRAETPPLVGGEEASNLTQLSPIIYICNNLCIYLISLYEPNQINLCQA